jgi:peroxiredoxin
MTMNWRTKSQGTIVYVFRPDCVWCLRNLGAMQAVAMGARAYSFIGISTTASGLRDYVAQHRIDYPVFVGGPEAIKRLKVLGTPTTIVISPDGHVKKAWSGAYRGEVGKQVASVFGLQLPTVDAN